MTRKFYNLVFNRTIERTLGGKPYVWKEGQIFARELDCETANYYMNTPKIGFVHSIFCTTHFIPGDDFNIAEVTQQIEESQKIITWKELKLLHGKTGKES